MIERRQNVTEDKESIYDRRAHHDDVDHSMLNQDPLLKRLYLLSFGVLIISLSALSPLSKPGCSRLRPITPEQAVGAVIKKIRDHQARFYGARAAARAYCRLGCKVYNEFNFFNPLNMLSRSIGGHYTVRLSYEKPGIADEQVEYYVVSSCGRVDFPESFLNY